MKQCDNSRTFFKELLLVVMWIVLIQGAFLGIKEIIFLSYEENLWSRSMVTMISMIVALVVLILYSRHKKYTLSALPQKFSVPYIIITVVAVAFYTVTLLFVVRFSLKGVLMLFYGSIITPVFEELLFRGVIWNRLNSHFSKEWKTYLTVTVLFALWHTGYAIGIYLWGGGSLLNCIVMKVMMGGIFGLITGAVRYKTKNCYAGILIHGVCNAFG